MKSITEQQKNSNCPLSPQKEWSEIIYAHYRATHPQDPLVQIESKLDFSQIELKCARYHHRKSGRGITHPISKLCRILFLKYWYGLSLRETEQLVNGSIVGKLFCGYALDEWCADHTLIGRLEAWVEENAERSFFDEILCQIDEEYGQESGKVQKGDTFGVEANAAKESLVRLIRHSGRKLLHAWGEEQKVTYEELLAQAGRDAIVGPANEKNYFRMTAEERANQLRESVKGAVASYRLSEKGKSEGVIEWREYIKKILTDEVNITYNDSGEIIEVRKKNKKERGSYRIGSATDPEATYRVHDGDVTFGYNGSVLTDGEFVREIRADTGATADATPLPQMLKDQAEHHQLIPEKLVYDKAAGSGKTIQEVSQATNGKTQLVAPMRRYDRQSERFTPRDFVLSDDGRSLSCPNGQETTTAYRSGSGDGWNYRFKAAQCEGCPLWDKCRKSEKKTMRQVFVSDYRVTEAKARAYEKTETYKKEMRSRSEVERVIACLVLYCGARRMRRRGLRAADFQLKMSGMVFNVKRLLRKEELARKSMQKAAAQKRKEALSRVDCV